MHLKAQYHVNIEGIIICTQTCVRIKLQYVKKHINLRLLNCFKNDVIIIGHEINNFQTCFE